MMATTNITATTTAIANTNVIANANNNNINNNTKMMMTTTDCIDKKNSVIKEVSPLTQSSLSTRSRKKLQLRDASGSLLIGMNVKTLYGNGRVINYRESDTMYIIEIYQQLSLSSSLSSETIVTTTNTNTTTRTTTTEAATNTTTTSSSSRTSSLTGMNVCHDTTTTTTKNNNVIIIATLFSQTVEVVRNWIIEYEELEQQRKQKFERECNERGLMDIKYDDCKICMMDRHEKQMEKLAVEGTLAEKEYNKKYKNKCLSTPKLIKLFFSKRHKATIQPCLICNRNCCSKHKSKLFHKSSSCIVVCISCEKYFDYNYLENSVSSKNISKRYTNVEQIIDLYDRCLIMLQYLSCQFVEQCIIELEKNEKHTNRIGLGTHTIGISSGALGIAAAATILTPVGTPLLIASFVCAFAATAIQGGAEAVAKNTTYYAEASKIADGVIALHSLILSLLRVTSALHNVQIKEQQEKEKQNGDGTSTTIDDDRTTIEKLQEEHRPKYMLASNMSRNMALRGAMYVETTATTSAGTTNAISRSAGMVANTAKFAQFAGGAVSAAVILLEANSLKNTITKIYTGDKCIKATELRIIQKQLDILIEKGGFPTSSSLNDECLTYLDSMAKARYGSLKQFRSLGTTFRSFNGNK